MTTKKLLIIKAGHKIPAVNAPGDYEHWIMTRGALPPEAVTVVDVTAADATLPPPDSLCGAIITGSAAMVTDELAWIKQTSNWIRAALTHPVPILGICFGHQLLAQALDGQVDYNPRGAEVGTFRFINHGHASTDPLFGALPPSFYAHASHQQAVITPPAGSIRLASSELDDCSAFVYQGRAWGVQFHPEFNADITRHYIERYRTLLQQQGRDVDQALAACQDSPTQHQTLRSFCLLALGRE